MGMSVYQISTTSLNIVPNVLGSNLSIIISLGVATLSFSISGSLYRTSLHALPRPVADVPHRLFDLIRILRPTLGVSRNSAEPACIPSFAHVEICLSVSEPKVTHCLMQS
jgi:hypothetical protein